MAHFRNILPLRTWPRYLLWHYAQRKPFRCKVQGGGEISIRPRPSHDYQTAVEIFSDRMYECGLEADSVRNIVDLGGNVGYSCLFWCKSYPNANVLTFEPHPIHCRLLEWHMAQNGFGNRVRLVAAAAGVADGVANFTNEDDGSAIVEGMPAGSMKVAVKDLFQVVCDAPIDLLKMDIEGSEYAILEDSRFDALAARTNCVLLEWHARGERGEKFCGERLASLGFAVRAGRNLYDQCGMLYCHKTQGY